ncbi:MAG: SH3 domain-containing protein [Silicimonas sp.]|nr:SH3 domain-containing protein [Silicimonas sp.]
MTDVAENDVLNIRAAPDASSPIIGSLSHDATYVEVIAPDDAYSWGLVNIGETSGWVSLRYLARHPAQLDYMFPDIRICAGTEPFWSLRRSDDEVAFDMPLDDLEPRAEDILWQQGTVNHRRRYSFRTESMVGVLSRQSCNDGMSDQEFGLELNLILLSEDLHLQGCCSIQPHAMSR